MNEQHKWDSIYTIRFSVFDSGRDSVFNIFLLKAIDSVALIIYGVHFDHLSILCISCYPRIKFLGKQEIRDSKRGCHIEIVDRSGFAQPPPPPPYSHSISLLLYFR